MCGGSLYLANSLPFHQLTFSFLSFGDQFQLLHSFKVSEPWERIHSTPSAPSKKPSELSYDELENELFTRLFATQKQRYVSLPPIIVWQYKTKYLICYLVIIGMNILDPIWSWENVNHAISGQSYVD